jgi:phospholipid/cholesterol/gamma-HCH transport system permease protein
MRKLAFSARGLGERCSSDMFAPAMDQPAGFTIEERDGRPAAVLAGDWTSTGLNGAERELQAAAASRPGLEIDARAIGRCDTAGAYAIAEAAAKAGVLAENVAARPDLVRLIQLVEHARQAPPRTEAVQPAGQELLTRIGRGVVEWLGEAAETLAFNGHLLVVLFRTLLDPRRFRIAPFFSLVERAGLDALPIVAVTSFFIGAVIAFIGADMLKTFGAQVFTVELIGVAMLREFGIVITAVLLAGRSASSFAAEIGAMKMNQEIDAMRVMGVDPFEALVVPRIMALLMTIPLLTFIAMVAGLFGGMMVTWSVLHLSPAFFVKRIAENVGAKHFWVGMSKAPVLAAVIAAIGCRQGMEVGGDVESLGRRVTSAVVHAIFAIILLDALFALMYTELSI